MNNKDCVWEEEPFADYSAEWPFAPSNLLLLRTLREMMGWLKRDEIRFRLINGEFRADSKAAKIQDHLCWIEANRRGLTLALLIEQKICIDCREKTAVRPQGAEPNRCEPCYWKRVSFTKTGDKNGDSNNRAEKGDSSEKPLLTLV